MSYTIDECYTAFAVLSAMNAADEVEKMFSQKDRNLLYSWFDSIWTKEDDNRIVEQSMSILEKKLKELKGN